VIENHTSGAAGALIDDGDIAGHGVTSKIAGLANGRSVSYPVTAYVPRPRNAGKVNFWLCRAETLPVLRQACPERS
jgi:hypothetical protein